MALLSKWRLCFNLILDFTSSSSMRKRGASTHEAHPSIQCMVQNSGTPRLSKGGGELLSRARPVIIRHHKNATKGRLRVFYGLGFYKKLRNFIDRCKEGGAGSSISIEAFYGLRICVTIKGMVDRAFRAFRG